MSKKNAANRSTGSGNKSAGKWTAFYKKRSVPLLCTALVILIALLIVAIIVQNPPAKKSSLSREQQLMEMVRSKNVIPCHISSINNFFFVYYGALASGDTSVLEDSYDNPKEAGISANISTMVNRISDIKVYVTPGLKKNEIAAFVKYNIYFKNISASAPSVDSFYISMNTSDSSIKIMTKMYTDSDVNELLSLISLREPIRSLLSDTENELNNILNTNTDLRNLYVVMSSMTDENE